MEVVKNDQLLLRSKTFLERVVHHILLCNAIIVVHTHLYLRFEFKDYLITTNFGISAFYTVCKEK